MFEVDGFAVEEIVSCFGVVSDGASVNLVECGGCFGHVNCEVG